MSTIVDSANALPSALSVYKKYIMSTIVDVGNNTK